MYYALDSYAFKITYIFHHIVLKVYNNFNKTTEKVLEWVEFLQAVALLQAILTFNSIAGFFFNEMSIN